MHAVLLVDRNGKVKGVGGTHEGELCNVAGKPCCEVVGARDANGRAWCTERCAEDLGRAATSDRELRNGALDDRGVHLRCTHVADSVVVTIDDAPSASRADVLTGREREVLDAFALGLTTRAVATRLRIGTGTVRTHLERLRRKLGAHTVAEAVAAVYGRK